MSANYVRIEQKGVKMEQLDFADYLPDESDDSRFKRYNRFLRSLREDTLLIVDNFNVTVSQAQFLDVMRKCRCGILFTTRSRYENHITQEVSEWNPDTWLELLDNFTHVQLCSGIHSRKHIGSGYPPDG